MGKRLNIALMIDDINNYFSNQATRGAEQACKAIDANLYVLPGHYIGQNDSRYSDKNFDFQFNSIFKLPTKRSVDIIYILQGLICSRAEIEKQKEFLDTMPDVPVVCLFTVFDGYNSVTFNNRSGFTQLLNHLIEDHDAKEIGYVSGPSTNRDANERLEVYKEVLKAHNIPFDDKKVVYGGFTIKSEEVVNELLDNNKNLDSIVFANDSMAVGGYSALRKRGIEPGKDIRITGFDDDVFAAALEPPLTTVEASSAQLTFKAVLNAENYMNGSALKDMTVDTHLIQRQSCGCFDFDSEKLSKRLKIDGIDKGDNSFIECISEYLFGFFIDSGAVSESEEKVDDYLKTYAEFITSEDKQDSVRKLNDKFEKLLFTNMFSITTPERIFNVLLALQHKALSVSENIQDKEIVYNAFASYLRRVALICISPLNSLARRNERIQGELNRQASEAYLSGADKVIPYDQLLGGLYEAGFKRSLLYLFNGKVKNNGKSDWTPPASVLLKAISDEQGTRVLPEEQQLLRVERIFENEFIPDDERHTMIIQPLFSGKEIFGYLVNEVLPNNYSSLSAVAIRLSDNLRSLFMIEEHNKAKKSFKDSLERFMKENTVLEEQATKDELTGLYNRRGFISNTEKKINDPFNKDKMAIICYADMDNLKMVNDKFGHDDGDFALQTIAHILKESFRDTDVIGRFGGDEFIAFAITGNDINTDNVKERINKISKRHNEEAGKPYPIEMSTGIYKFKLNGKNDIYDVINKADELLYEEKLKKKEQGKQFR